MALPALLAIVGIGAIAMPFAYLGGMHAGFSYTVSMIFTAVVLVLEALALPGLFKKTKSGWRLLFYAILVSAVQSLITFNLGGLIIGTILGLYILFQVKEYYK